MKKLLVLLLAAVMVLSFAACDRNGSTEESTTVGQSSDTVEEATEAPTQPETPTEKATEQPTEDSTAALEPATDAPTEPPTETPTEPPTEPVTELGDISASFASDIDTQTVGGNLTSTDLSGFFTGEYPTGGGKVIDGAYLIDGISDMYAAVDGKYVYTVDVSSMGTAVGNGYVFVRGAGHGQIYPNGFTPDHENGVYQLNNYYETNGAPHQFAGAAGICVNVQTDKLTVTIKCYDEGAANRIRNEVYEFPYTGSRLTFVDDNDSVLLYAGTTLVTKFRISNPVTYDDMVCNPEAQFAGKILFSAADGQPVMLKNTLVNVSAVSELGIVARACDVAFTSVRVDPLSKGAIPGEPIILFNKDAILTASDGTSSQGCELTESGFDFVTLVSNGNDPYFTLAQNVTGGRYALVKYRAAEAAQGEFFVGSEGAPRGGDSVVFDYEKTVGLWSYAIVDLTGSPLYDGHTVAYLRYDFFTAAVGKLDVAYVALFNSPDDAMAFAESDKTGEILDKTDEMSDFKAFSFDTFYINNAMYFPVDGLANEKLAAQDNLVELTAAQVGATIRMRGWIGFYQDIANFGYYVDDSIIFGEGDEFFRPTEDPVYGMAGQYAHRYDIEFSVAELSAGSHKIATLAQLEDGRIVRIYEITLVIPEAEDDPGTGDEPDAVVTIDQEKAQYANHSFDECEAYRSDDSMIKRLFTPGVASEIADVTELSADTAKLRIWGWFGTKTAFDQVGYMIDDNDPVYEESFLFPAGPEIRGCVGTDYYSRMNIYVDVSALEGQHTVAIVYMLEDGTTVKFIEFTINKEIAAKPVVDKDDPTSQYAKHSFDESESYRADGSMIKRLFTPGVPTDMAPVTDLSTDTATLRVWGWFGTKAAFTNIGYMIDDGTPVFDANYLVPAEANIRGMVGTDFYTRMKIWVDVSALEGQHTVAIVYMLEDGTTVKFIEFKVNKAAA